jgi:pimeloyl-ACP methyl ester carboxylesterase
MFSWETGLGVALDQVASNEYKRAKAAKLADKIVAFHRGHPNTPVTLVGFSAGAVVAMFTLESLPDSPIVENVVLLSGSLSADYDLTSALARRLRTRLGYWSCRPASSASRSARS